MDRLMNLQSIWIYFCFIILLQNLSSLEIVEDERYIYTKYGLSEICDDRQRELIHHFTEKVADELNRLDVPTFWSKEAEQILLANQDRFNDIISETKTRADHYAATHHIELKDLIPTGFIIGLGVGGSGNYTVSIGGSALLTLIIVPIQVERLDKITREVKTYFESSWALGGFGQGGMGVGIGESLGARGAIGMIWGPLPEAFALNGVAIGAVAHLSAVEGLGFKIALIFNTSTGGHNLVAMATYDMGLQAGTSIEGSFFYFLTADEILGFMSNHKLKVASGQYIVDADKLTSLIENKHE